MAGVQNFSFAEAKLLTAYLSLPAASCSLQNFSFARRLTLPLYIA